MDNGFVVVDIGAVRMAVPVAEVVQGIATPARLDVLPRRGAAAGAGAIIGLFNHLGQPLALLDLALWVKFGDDDTPRRYRRALIVRADGHTVAIAVDAVRGLHRIGADSITRISHDVDQNEIFHSVARCTGIDGVVNVLDVRRLMALAMTWSADEAGAREASAVAAPRFCAATHVRAAYAVVAGSGCGIGFALADLREVLPAPALDAFHAPLTEGLCRWRGRHLPVTSIAKIMPALAASAPSAPTLMAVFERDGMALGVLIDQVPVIRHFTVGANDTDGADGANGANGVDDAGHADGADLAVADGGASPEQLVHLVDMAALLARFPERALSLAAAAVDSGPAARRNPSSHIVFAADGVVSTPIDGIEALLPLPALAPGAAHMAWRGNAIALHDLRAAPGERGTVIVVNGRHAPLGFIVDAVQALVQARAGRLSHLALAGRGAVELMTVGAGAGRGGGEATYATRDLAQLARTLG